MSAMRIVVTGREGQVAQALAATAPDEVVLVGRPDLDLEKPETIAAAIAAARPDVVVSAAAYTAVDQAESERERAFAVNETGAGAVAAVARALGVPVVHISTDYVFPGTQAEPYRESDAVGPVSVYGLSKEAGERAVAAANPDHAILRTAWVYAPYGKNFVRTMLRLAETRDVVRVVADQEGAPSYAPDLAAAILAVARNLAARPDEIALRGVFHITNRGETTWAGFAEAIFAGSAARGGPKAAVEPISTRDYPTPARRPAQSRLDCSKLAAAHGVVLPDWRDALSRCLDQLLPAQAAEASETSRETRS